MQSYRRYIWHQSLESAPWKSSAGVCLCKIRQAVLSLQSWFYRCKPAFYFCRSGGGGGEKRKSKQRIKNTQKNTHFFLFKELACSCKHSLCRQILLAELFLLAELCKCNSRFVAVPTSASPRRPCGYPGGQSGCSLTPGWQGVNGLVHDTSLKPLASHQAVLTNPDLLGQIRISRLACMNDDMYCRGPLGAPCLSLYHEKEKKKKKIIYIFGLIASLDR